MSVIDFIPKFRAFREEERSVSLAKKMREFNFFFGDYFRVKESALTMEKDYAPRFNLFKVIRVETRETKLHSPILAHLLNPRGDHSQSLLFHDSFVRQVLPTDYAFISKSFTPWQIRVHNEFYTSYGNLDIIINYSNGVDRFAIVIENKIYAGDQNDQIARYYSYCRKILRMDEDQIRIIYLTLKGQTPSNCSIDGSLFEMLSKNDRLHCISYEKAIIPWLTMLIPRISAANVLYVVKQYIQTLNFLCHGTYQ